MRLLQQQQWLQIGSRLSETPPGAAGGQLEANSLGWSKQLSAARYAKEGLTQA